MKEPLSMVDVLKVFDEELSQLAKFEKLSDVIRDQLEEVLAFANRAAAIITSRRDFCGEISIISCIFRRML